MGDTEELPFKRRKIEEVSEHNGDPLTESELDGKTSKIKSPVSLHIKPNAIARLRQIAKNSNIINASPQKHADQQKDDSEVTLTTANSRDKNQNEDHKDGETADSETNENAVTSTEGNRDVIISSTGSSPAHSPKPEDLLVLSTPPKKAWAKENHNHVDSNVIDVSKNLTDRFDQPEEHRVTNDDNQSKDKKVDTVVIDEEKENTKPAELKPEDAAEPKPSSAEPPPLSLDTGELKKVLKAMIDEKFKQVEDIYQNQGSENELRERIVRLEDENRDLQEYAAKLEKAVKLLLNNQKNKKDRQNKSAQTDDVVLASVNTPKTVIPIVLLPTTIQKLATPKPTIPPTPPTLTAAAATQIPQQLNQVNMPGSSTVATSRPTLTPATQMPQQMNQINKPGSSTVVTSRLTSTQAVIPGHSVTPASLPQRATYTQQQIRVASPTVQVPQGQRSLPPQYPANVPPLRPSVPTSPTRRPAPVTVTVHPQTTTTTMIPSPSYPAQIQKSTYVTNTITTLPAQQRPRPPVLHQQQTPVQRMTSPQPMVVYQRPPVQQAAQVVQPVQQYSNSVAMRSPATRPSPVNNNSPSNQTRPIQNSFQQIRPQIPPNMTISPRGQVVANQDQANNFQLKDLPGRPTVSIAVVSNGIVLSWNMNNAQTSSRIARYQLFALQDVGSNAAQWKKIGVVNALPLPMACTLTQFMPGNKYHFTVRAQDDHGRCGPLSEPCTVTLT